MATGIAIVGKSGGGKTASARTLPTRQTFFISPYKNELSFEPEDGERYEHLLPDRSNRDTCNFVKLSRGNSTIVNRVPRWLQYVNEQRPEIKYLYLEDITHWMHDYTNGDNFRAKANTVEKWSRWGDFGSDMYQALFQYTQELRDDLFLIFTFHTEMDQTGVQKIRTSGKMLDDNIEIPSYLNYVFYTKVDPYNPNEPEANRYWFTTNDDGFRPAKTPMNLFGQMYIPNDMREITRLIMQRRGNQPPVLTTPFQGQEAQTSFPD